MLPTTSVPLPPLNPRINNYEKEATSTITIVHYLCHLTETEEVRIKLSKYTQVNINILLHRLVTIPWRCSSSSIRPPGPIRHNVGHPSILSFLCFSFCLSSGLHLIFFFLFAQSSYNKFTASTRRFCTSSHTLNVSLRASSEQAAKSTWLHLTDRQTDRRVPTEQQNQRTDLVQFILGHHTRLF